MNDLTQIVVTIIPILGSIILLRMQQKKAERKNRDIEKKNTEYRVNIFNGLVKKVDNISNVLNNHVSEDKNDNKIRQAILDKSLDIISANSDLSQNIKHLLISGHRALTDFALNYYNSSYRHNDREKLEYLKIVTDSINDKLKQIALQQFKTKKKVRGEDIDFVDFIKRYTKIYIVIQVFIQTLVKNGLSHQGYIDLCKGFITDAYREGIEGWRNWNKI